MSLHVAYSLDWCSVDIDAIPESATINYQKRFEDSAKDASTEAQGAETESLTGNSDISKYVLDEKQRNEDEEVQNNIKDYFTEKRKDDDEDYLKMKASLKLLTQKSYQKF
jgi:hypothetical protein